MPYGGSLVDQPSGAIHRFEVIMRIRDEEEKREASKVEQGPPEK